MSLDLAVAHVAADQARARTRRAQAIYAAMRPVAQVAAHAAWTAGYLSWEVGQPCVNPYDERTSADLWAAFQMGWQQCQEANGGR